MKVVAMAELIPWIVFRRPMLTEASWAQEDSGKDLG
jgi:hypothetical protein